MTDTAHDRVTLEVRARAIEILFAVGSVKLCRIAMFRAAKWARISTDDPNKYFSDIARVRSTEWRRIFRALSNTI